MCQHKIKKELTIKNSDGRSHMVLTDGSKIITEAMVKAGAEVYIGYPITPSNLFYAYAQKRFPSFYAAPDEISVMQWMSGFSATGKIPVSATAFPGLALMTESLNMAYMMELPMVLIVTQRLGPSTGSATTGAQGDLSFINSLISGGYPLPVFCPSNFEDCWNLAAKCVETAVTLRTPVILLTSKEMVMTNRSFNLANMPPIKPVKRQTFKANGIYKSYQAGENLVPHFVSLGNPQSLDNTRRLKKKIEQHVSEYNVYELDQDVEAKKLVVSYGISSYAAREAILEMRGKGEKVALLIIKTLLPLSRKIMEIMDQYDDLLFVEENIGGQLKELIFGKKENINISSINKIGSMISPKEILEELV